MPPPYLPTLQLVLLENVRFYKQEEKNDAEFAKQVQILGMRVSRCTALPAQQQAVNLHEGSCCMAVRPVCDPRCLWLFAVCSWPPTPTCT